MENANGNTFLCIISISMILFLLTGCSHNKKASKVESDIDFNSLIEKAISIQYGNEDIEETDVFSKNYIDKIPEEQNFYKEQLNPYKIIRSNIEEIKSTADENLDIWVRIADEKGEYIQVLHMVKIDERYYIDNIEYDI